MLSMLNEVLGDGQERCKVPGLASFDGVEMDAGALSPDVPALLHGHHAVAACYIGEVAKLQR
jgi:hypothetical protein